MDSSSGWLENLVCFLSKLERERGVCLCGRQTSREEHVTNIGAPLTRHAQHASTTLREAIAERTEPCSSSSEMNMDIILL